MATYCDDCSQVHSVRYCAKTPAILVNSGLCELCLKRCTAACFWHNKLSPLATLTAQEYVSCKMAIDKTKWKLGRQCLFPFLVHRRIAMAFFFVHLYVPLFPTFFLLLVRVLSWCLPGRHTGRTWVKGLLEEVAEVRPRAIAILFTMGLKCDGCVGFRPLFCSLLVLFFCLNCGEPTQNRIAKHFFNCGRWLSNFYPSYQSILTQL